MNKLSQKAKELISAPFDYLDTTRHAFAADPYNMMITSEMNDRKLPGWFVVEIIYELPGDTE